MLYKIRLYSAGLAGVIEFVVARWDIYY